jgi:hypothetical protein
MLAYGATPPRRLGIPPISRVNFIIICELFSAICESDIIDIGMKWVLLRPALVTQ